MTNIVTLDKRHMAHYDGWAIVSPSGQILRGDVYDRREVARSLCKGTRPRGYTVKRVRVIYVVKP